MSKDDIINVDPEILRGRPVFTGTRVPIDALFEYIEGGSTIGEFREDFPSVTVEQIIALLEYSKLQAVA